LPAKDCGSEFVFEIAVNRYSASAYSSMAGGDMVVIQGIPLSMRVCVCGRPLAPVISGGRTGRGVAEAAALVTAVEGALQNREKVPAVLADLVAFSKKAVTKRQLDEVVGRLKAVEGALSRFDEMAGRLKALEKLVGTKEKKTGKTRKEDPGE
jgi:hypothetical protein